MRFSRMCLEVISSSLRLPFTSRVVSPFFILLERVFESLFISWFLLPTFDLLIVVGEIWFGMEITYCVE